MASATPIRDGNGAIRWQPTLETGERPYVFDDAVSPAWLTTWHDHQPENAHHITMHCKPLAIWTAAREEHRRSRRRARFRPRTSVPVHI